VNFLACFAAGVHTDIEMVVADRELLEDFARRRSDSAFAEIVSRYANLVNAAALRQVRDPHLAQDVTQATFIVLSRRAGSVPAERLPGWLILTARFCAKDALKKQVRRIQYEQEAASMRPIVTEPTDASQTEIAGVLDEALSHLRFREATAVAMRYLQNRPMASVAEALGVSVDAAQKTVSRSLLKLRKILLRRGVVVSAAGLSAALLHESAQTAPAALAVSTAGASVQSLSIAKGAINMMLWAKLQVAAAVTAGVLLTGGGGAVVLTSALAGGRPVASSAAPVAPAAPAAPAAAAQTQPDADSLIREGWDLCNRGRLDPAAAKFEQAIQLAPQSAEAWNGLGWTLAYRTPVLAEETFNYAVALDSNHVEAGALNGLGGAYFWLNEYNNAEQAWLAAVPRSSGAEFGLAKLYLLKGDWDDAAKYAKMVLDSNDKFQDSAQQQQLTNQLRAILKAAQDHKLPDHLRNQIMPPATSSEITKGGLGRSKMEQIGQSFKAVLDKYPNDTDALNGMAWVEYRTDNLDAAQRDFQTVLNNNPHHHRAMDGMARTLHDKGEIDAAIALWQQALQEHPGDDDVVRGLADAYMERGDSAKAIPLLQWLLKSNPNDQDAKAKLQEAGHDADAK